MPSYWSNEESKNLPAALSKDLRDANVPHEFDEDGSGQSSTSRNREWYIWWSRGRGVFIVIFLFFFFLAFDALTFISM